MSSETSDLCSTQYKVLPMSAGAHVESEGAQCYIRGDGLYDLRLWTENIPVCVCGVPTAA